MSKLRPTCLVLLSLATLASSAVHAETWPQFRGETGSGVSAEQGLPTQWSAKSGVKWKTALTGRANSSPAITANRIDLTSQTEDNSLLVLSFDRETGKLLRSVNVGRGTLVAKGPGNLYAHRHNAATPTPCADDDHTYAYFGTGLLVCLDAETGKIVWQKDMVKEYGPYKITFGMGSSPRLWGDLLIVSCMTKGPSYVVAFDKKTGKEVWKSDRSLPAADDGPDAYSTPLIFANNGRDELLISGSDHINSYNPKTGKQNWLSSGLTIDSPYGRVIASATAEDGIVVATSGNPGGGGKGLIIAVKSDGKGDVTKSKRLWKYNRSTPDSSTPIAYKGHVYTMADKGVATCLDLKSGEEVWQKRLGEGPFHGSLVAGDGKVYFQGIDGTCNVVEAGPEGKVLAENELPGTFYSTPAISDGVLYFRAYETLFAIDGE